jgi:TetR/AcrR family transcriptional repressor of nem operon
MPGSTRRHLDDGPVPRAGQILDVAERLIQTRGFNGFSYADISAELGITKASLHYHFRTKADLGRALVVRYSETFSSALAGIDAACMDALAKLESYARLYAQVLEGERMCLCGMLAAEHSTLPREIQDEIRRFFDSNEEWLSKVLTEGRQDGTLQFDDEPCDVARLLLGALEGAMLVARPYADPTRFEVSAKRLLEGFRQTRAQ